MKPHQPEPKQTQRYAVLGNPVEHSLSPWIHGQFAQQTGHHIIYDRVLSPLEGFKATLDGFIAQGALGCNITVPFKFEAFSLAQTCSPRALLAEAVNTLRFDETGWVGDNTDGAGLVKDITFHAQKTIYQQRVLLIGAGGAAAGVLGPILEQKPTHVRVVNRRLDRAIQLVERHQKLAYTFGVQLDAHELIHACSPLELGWDIVINATASSLNQEAIPVSSAVLGTNCLAVDLMYGPAAQHFMSWAQTHGARARDGLGMLVEQAAEAFYFWRGIRPTTTEILAQLRERLGHGKG